MRVESKKEVSEQTEGNVTIGDGHEECSLAIIQVKAAEERLSVLLLRGAYPPRAPVCWYLTRRDGHARMSVI